MNIEFTAPRRRMARMPHGATLVANPVSGAPGFQTENVFTLAGVPSIARACWMISGRGWCAGR